jgi:dTDP-4-amino-4,6-dideoxygalactose transaminase
MTEPQAAAGVVQLGRLADIRQARRALVDARMKAWEEDGTSSHVATVRAPGDIPYMHTVTLSEQLGQERHAFVEMLASRGIGSKDCGLTHRTHDIVGRGVVNSNTPRAERFAGAALCLPLHPAMQPDDEVWLSAAVAEAARACV